MSQSIDMKGQQVKKERVDVAETLKQNPTRKRLWRKPKNPTENDGNTQIGDHINCPTEGIFRLHPLESPDPEVRGQFKTSAHETPGPSRIPSVPGHTCVGSTDIETSVWSVIARNSKKRKREEDEGDEELKPERKRARRTGSWLPSKKRKREEDEDDEMCKPPPKRARHTGGWVRGLRTALQSGSDEER
uniref:Uncharacterized protein n=1 Tax=Magallana gigas TaxID=29159 RepID=K1S501_MAGGI